MTYSVDLRYNGQGFEIPVPVDIATFDGSGAGLEGLRNAFDAEHKRLFDFLLDVPHELVTLRATASGPRPDIGSMTLGDGDADPSDAKTREVDIWVDGCEVAASVYDREKLLAGNVIHGPAIITEMDSTTLVLPDHAATVHPSGSLLIRPTDSQEG